MKSRKQRKLEARQEGLKFVPQYNSKGVVSHDDFYGVGNERFNNKFVQFNKVEEIVVQDEQVDVIDSDGLPWKEYEPSTEEKVEDEIVNESNWVDEIKYDDENNRLVVDGEINAREINGNDQVVLEDKPKGKKAKKESKWKKKIKKLFNK